MSAADKFKSGVGEGTISTFGGPNDPLDNGETRCGFSTKDNPNAMYCSLPKSVWDTLGVKCGDTITFKRGEKSATATLYDLGPSEYLNRIADVGPAVFTALGYNPSRGLLSGTTVILPSGAGAGGGTGTGNSQAAINECLKKAREKIGHGAPYSPEEFDAISAACAYLQGDNIGDATDVLCLQCGISDISACLRCATGLISRGLVHVGMNILIGAFVLFGIYLLFKPQIDSALHLTVSAAKEAGKTAAVVAV